MCFVHSRVREHILLQKQYVHLSSCGGLKHGTCCVCVQIFFILLNIFFKHGTCCVCVRAHVRTFSEDEGARRGFRV